ncbi:unnamed protein product [Lampetra planeri]
MDLGKAKLLRTGVNSLHQAIHPIHGIAWTDGKQVCLTALYFVNGEVKFGDTNVIGQFEHVFGLFWGPLCCSDSPALLAVQHKKHVTVWQLQLSALEQNKLLCTQTCEMSEPFPLLSQGCVWHPKLDILAVLTKRDTSVLFSVRVDNRRIKADIKGSGLIHCACWTKDGTRLVVAIGSALHSYIWNDIQKSLSPCSFCPIFDVGGLHLCYRGDGGSSETEPLRVHGSPVLSADGDNPLDSRRRSSESDRSFFPSSGPLDLTHLLARHRRSDPSPLIHLRRKDTVTGSGQDSSHLILITYERKVTTTRKGTDGGLVEEVRSEPSPVTSTVDFPDRATSSASSITVENFDADHVHRMASLAVSGQLSRDSSRASSPRLEPSDKMEQTLPMHDRTSGAAKERALEQLVHNMERLFTRFADVQQCLTEIREVTHNGRKGPSVYPNACEPPYVNVTCQKQLSENVFIDERRPVLLCDGKLCLRALQELFNLTIVEMMYGPLWLVLVADADGFVPLTFKAKEELTVRNGKREKRPYGLPAVRRPPAQPARPPNQNPNTAADTSS